MFQSATEKRKREKETFLSLTLSGDRRDRRDNGIRSGCKETPVADARSRASSSGLQVGTRERGDSGCRHKDRRHTQRDAWKEREKPEAGVRKASLQSPEPKESERRGGEAEWVIRLAADQSCVTSEGEGSSIHHDLTCVSGREREATEQRV